MRKNSCYPCRVVVLSLVLLLPPRIVLGSSRGNAHEYSNSHDLPSVTPRPGSLEHEADSDGSGIPHLEHEFSRRLLLGEMEKKPLEGWKVPLLHKDHPRSPTGRGKKLKEGEHLAERILLDKHRQKSQKHHLRKRLAHFFPELDEQNAGGAGFLSPVVSGSSQGSGQYFIDFYLGTPAQKFSLIADTGSDVIWVQCSPCTSCYSQVGPLFSSKDSSTYQPLACNNDVCQYVPPPVNATCDARNPGVCDYAYGYSDGSQSTGDYGTDTATMNVTMGGKNVRIADVAFGCGYDNGGPSLTAAGGIIGLGQGALSFTSQIGAYFGNKFSYCLVNYLDAPTISSTLVFGSVTSNAKEQVLYTPFIANQYVPSLYYVGVQCVSVGGKAVLVPPQVWQVSALGDGGTIVDSGTTLTIFLEVAYLPILNAFQSQINCYPRVPPSQGLDFCFDTSSVSDPKKLGLPSFSMTFEGGAVFNPPNENIYVPVSMHTYCLAMAGSTSPFGYNVLGNLIQQNFEITYDRQNQKFGFAQADCSSV